MDSVSTLVVGAGISGLSTAAFLSHSAPQHDYLVLEGDAAIGGYCKTVRQDGFVWDYSGHFFHFKHPEIESYLRERMPNQNIRTVRRRSSIAYAGGRVDFPFQKNIHQLPKDEFIDCLHDLFFARFGGASDNAAPERNFKDMLYARFGRAIAEKFLIPYNEKLYACDLATLDRDAMGRFFPHADVADIIRNMKTPDNASYNASFTYPEGGAFEYVKAIARDLQPSRIAVSEPVLSIDLARKVARTSKREIAFQSLVSSMPFPRLLQATGLAHDAADFTWNQVLVFNLGFDTKGSAADHWVYFPDRGCSFYRVGYYDNIFDAPRMSLYVELGFPRGQAIDVGHWRKQVLTDLRTQDIVTTQKLISHHAVVMDPAYVHITQRSLSEVARLKASLRERGVHAIGRYGGWTYCSIEDNIVEARALVNQL